MGKLFYAVLVVLLLVGCTPPVEPVATGPNPPVTVKEVIQEKEAVPEQEAIPEPVKILESQPEIIEIPNDIKEILQKGKTKLTSYSYNYKKPENELPYEIYVKGNNIKVVLPEVNTEEQGKFYNTIFIDTEKKTAQAYCIGYSSCEGKVGKVKYLDFEESYIETPLDWLEKVTKADIIDERQVEGRKAVYIDTNIGKLTVESFYGFLYRIEDGNKVWEFTDASFNSLKDSDVVPG